MQAVQRKKEAMSTVHLFDVTIYLESTFGIMKIDCREFECDESTYSRKAIRGRKATTQPIPSWLVVLRRALAIPVDSGMVQDVSGVMVSRYPARDPRYRTDFEGQMGVAGITPAFSVGFEGYEPNKCFKPAGIIHVACKECDAQMAAALIPQHYADHVMAGWGPQRDPLRNSWGETQ